MKIKSKFEIGQIVMKQVENGVLYVGKIDAIKAVQTLDKCVITYTLLANDRNADIYEDDKVVLLKGVI